jgi:hypothetical protein
MAHAVYKIPKANVGRLQEVFADDTVSRQSITTRDADTLGIRDNCMFVLIEGSEGGVKRATEVFTTLKVGELANAHTSDLVRQKIKDEEDAAAGGMGMVFGDF